MSAPTFPDLWSISRQPHGAFLMYGNYCVARLDDYSAEPRRMYEALAAGADLITALSAVHETIVRANLCPFGIALALDLCGCNYHAAAKHAAVALAKVQS